ncbi:MAG TPA: DUF1697 domain-containing protein [Candidatus Eisenbacteria bacterium]|nr:DUF1697 domain-containing protein [Candidatus Eisenbacteria bacterium]
MAWVVFLRGVNVGGHKAFRPSVVAKDLAQLDVVNIGAAGTFVVKKSVNSTLLRTELSRRLPFVAEFMICRARDVSDLGSEDPFPRAGPDVTRYVSVLSKRPRTLVPLPIRQPANDDWQVKVVEVRSVFALSLHRRVGRTLVYPNEVVEKHFGVPATTRNWNTVRAICDVLKAG